jgi:hypothetical protein
MFHVLDHADVVYTGELSQTTQYVMEHYGSSLDEAIRSGIRITYADPRLQWSEVGDTRPGLIARNFWQSVEDWEID